MVDPTRVLVVDDHALFRDGLISLIGRWAELRWLDPPPMAARRLLL